ncbi:MAG: CHAT domain-containing protein [Bacteroidales bacterium]|nr:CHAT domain-containing protein [Bacteroidales bacterium]
MKKLSLILLAAVLAVACPVVSGQTKKEADKLLKQAENLLKAGEVDGSYSLSQQAETIYKALGQENTYEYASVLWLESQAYDIYGEGAASEETMSKALDILRPMAERYADEYIHIMGMYAMRLASNGKYEECAATTGSIDSFYSGLQKPSRKTTAKYYAIMGCLMDLMGQSSEARPLLEKACEQAKAVYGKRSLEFIDSRSNLAMCYYALGMIPESKALAKTVLADMEGMQGVGALKSNTLDLLANCEVAEGDFESALKHFRELEDYLQITTPGVTEYLVPPVLKQANCLKFLERCEEAVSRNEEAIRMIKDSGQEGTYLHLSALSNLAGIYAKQGNIQGLTALSDEIQRMGQGDVNCSSSLIELAGILTEAEMYDSADACLRGILATVGDNPSFQAIRLYALEGLFLNAAQSGNDRLTRESSAMLVEQYEKLGRHDSYYHNAIAALVLADMADGNYQKAVERLDKARQSVRETSGPESELYASVLSATASASYSLGLIDDAVAAMTESVELYRNFSDAMPDVYFYNLWTLSNYEHIAGLEDKAISHLEEAVQFAKDKYGTASQQYIESLGSYLERVVYSGDVYLTTKLLRKNLKLFEEFYKDDPGALVQIYSSAALSYASAGDTGQAQYYSDLTAKAAYGIIANSDDLEEQLKGFFSLNNTIPRESYIRLWDSFFRNREEEIKGLGAEVYVNIFNALCQAYTAQGDKALALKYGLQVLESEINNPYGEKVKFSTAMTLFTAGFKDAALPYIKKFYSSAGPAASSRIYDVYALAALMLYSFDNGDSASCTKYCREFTERFRKFVKANFGNMTFDEKSAFWAQNGMALDAIPYIAGQYTTPEICCSAYDALLTGKGILLSSEVDLRSTIRKSGNKQAAELLDRILMEKNRLGQLPDGPSHDSLASVIYTDEDRLIELSAEFGDYMKSFTTGWKDVRKNLGPSEAAVEFASYNYDGQDTYLAFIVKRNSASPTLVKLFSGEELQAVNKERYYSSADLFKLIWKPLEGQLKGISTIYFSPSGELNNIPIEYLANDSGMRQNQRYKLFRLTSTREIERRRTARRAGSSVLYGGIDFNAGAPQLAEANKSFPVTNTTRQRSDVLRDERGSVVGMTPLPGTLREINEIQPILEARHIACTHYDGPRATEESFKALSGGAPAILHVATHGFYWNEAQARRNSFMPSMEGSGMREEDKALSRSGLMLAGVNNSILGRELPDNLEDGILTARDISMMDLQGTDLLVMAACKSGLGEIRGDGVFGLQRGFKKAGVHTIVMSLWNVDDDATQMLMTSFYSSLLSGGMRPVDALEKAQETVRASYPDPRYWAAFIILDGN